MNEADPSQVKTLNAFLRARNVGGLYLDANASYPSQYRYQQHHMPQSGTQIDKNIVFRERTGVDQMENMAHRGGLIEHHLGVRVGARLTRLTELENTAHYLITVVIAEAGTWACCFVPSYRSLNPVKQCLGRSATHDLGTDGFVNVVIGRLHPGLDCFCRAMNPVFCIAHELLQCIEALLHSRRLHKGGIGVQAGKQVLQIPIRHSIPSW